MTQFSMDGAPTADPYIQLAQIPPSQAATVGARMLWIVRADGDSRALVAPLRSASAIGAVDPEIAASSVCPLEGVVAGALERRRARSRSSASGSPPWRGSTSSARRAAGPRPTPSTRSRAARAAPTTAERSGLCVRPPQKTCTFEVLARQFRITTAAVRRMAEIAHDLDMKDNRYGAAESAAVRRMIDGIRQLRADDAALLERRII